MVKKPNHFDFHNPQLASNAIRRRIFLLIIALVCVLSAMIRLRKPEQAEAINQLFAPHAPPLASTSSRTATLPPPIPKKRKQLDRALLDSIVDNAPFRQAERDAWQAFFELANNPNPKVLQSRSIGTIDVVQLLAQPAIYRGHVLTVTGKIQRIESISAPESLPDIDSYFRLVLRPLAQQLTPVVIYTTEIPVDWSPGDELDLDATVLGLFFKNWSYLTTDEFRIAPVIVAGEINPGITPASPVAERPGLAVEENDADLPTRDRQDMAAYLELAGWDRTRLQDIASAARKLSEIEALFHRLAQIAPYSEETWRFVDWPPGSRTHRDDAPEPSSDTGELLAGELVKLRGKVVALQLAPEEKPDRSTVGTNFCAVDMVAANRLIRVLVCDFPQQWLHISPRGEEVACDALFLDDAPCKPPPDCLRPTFASLRIGWFPNQAAPPDIHLGHTTLASLGFDVGLLDLVQDQRELTAEDGETFYAMLLAAAQTTPGQLYRAAQRNAKHFANNVGIAADTKETLQVVDPKLRRIAWERAAQGQFSVAPLFNESTQHRGELVALQGIARRAVRIAVSADRPTDLPPSVRASGLKEYFEVELFPEDSQNYPVVCCLATLPDDFPLGGQLREPVAVAGFFFKSWRYRTRGGSIASVQPEKEPSRQRQFAPLIIGPGLLRLPAPDFGSESTLELVAGLAFLALLCGIAAAIAWKTRGDRQFARDVLDRQRHPDESVSFEQLTEISNDER